MSELGLIQGDLSHQVFSYFLALLDFQIAMNPSLFQLLYNTPADFSETEVM